MTMVSMTMIFWETTMIYWTIDYFSISTADKLFENISHSVNLGAVLRVEDTDSDKLCDWLS